MRDDIIILPQADADLPPQWLRVVDGRVVQRGSGADWRHPDDEGAGTEPGRALLVLPPHATTLHWIACPDMTVPQGAVAARIIALESSIGAAGQLHAVTIAAPSPEQPHIVAVTSDSAMTHWVNWCADHGVPDARIVPAALLLPAPDAGFVRAQVGPSDVVRGVDSAFDGEEPAAALILGEAPVAEMPPPALQALLIAALDDPPLDLRQGAFAPPAPRLLEPARLKRLALLVGLILLAALLVSLVKIVRLNAEASRLDAQTVELARTVDPAVADAADAELKITAKLGARGGNGGFTGVLAGIMSAMRANPAVSLTSVNQTGDGGLRVQFAAGRAEDINQVLIALQEAGWRISANAVQQQGGRLVADIMVVH